MDKAERLPAAAPLYENLYGDIMAVIDICGKGSTLAAAVGPVSAAIFRWSPETLERPFVRKLRGIQLFLTLTRSLGTNVYLGCTAEKQGRAEPDINLVDSVKEEK